MANLTPFDKAFSRLNDQQKKAVTSIDGPVLTLAGPGTGKTQILTLRIGQILRQTQMNPYNILCLTYTESAAMAMKDRLSQLIGSAAYDVTITTFHSFANTIIQEFNYKFGSIFQEDEDTLSFQDLTPLDDLGRLKIIAELLSQKTWRVIKPFKQPLRYLQSVATALQDMKRERIDPSSLAADCHKHIDLLKQKDKKKDLTTLIKLERTIELVKLFGFYQKELSQRNAYDYEDMINWVVDKLYADPELALIYQEKYQYILVDEYQDTNSSQLALLNRLTSFETAKANIFVVGDPNQSIYRFQGASMANIETFKTKYPGAIVINLLDNYRSGQALLDTVGQLISQDSHNKASQQLKAHTSKPGRVVVTTYQNDNQEAALIADSIKKLIAKKIPAKEIAILVRKNYQIDTFARVLDEYKIPYQTVKRTHLLKNSYIERLLTILQTIVDPFDQTAFKKTCYLLANHFGLMKAYTLSRQKPADLFLAVDQQLKMIPSDSDNFISSLAELSKMTTTYPAIWVIEKTIEKFSLFKEIDGHPDRLLILNLLKGLYDNAKQSKDMNLTTWLDHVQELKKYNLDISHTDILYGQDEAVVIQTVHQAKGKEYEYVFLPQLEESIWLTKKPELFWLRQLTKQGIETREEEVDEARRLLYVGITRAKTDCFVSVSANREASQIVASRFLSEFQNTRVTQRSIEQNDKVAISQVKRSMQPLSRSVFSGKETAWLKEIIHQRPLNPTSFCAFLNCPRNYFLKNVLRLPTVKTEALAYGTSVHAALEIYFKEYQQSHFLPGVDILTEAFSQSLDKEILSQLQKNELNEKGRLLLKNFYTKKSAEFSLPIRTEYNFGHQVHLDSIPLTGKIDKIEWLDQKRKTVRVIDYKTGQVKSRNALLGLTKNPDTNYLTQLKFYCVLGQLDRKFSSQWTIAETQLQFLDEEHRFVKESFSFSQKELTEFTKQIKSVWDQILTLQFIHNPSSANCEYCQLITL